MVEGLDMSSNHLPMSQKNARAHHPRAATSAPIPIFDRGTLSRVTKPTKKKVLSSESLVARQSHWKRRSDIAVDAATRQASAAANGNSVLPSLTHGPQDETTAVGPYLEWGHIGFPSYGGNANRPELNTQAGFPFDMTTALPQIPGRYQSPWPYDEVAHAAPSGSESMRPTWDQGGFRHINPEGHTQPDHPNGTYSSTSLAYGPIFPRFNLSNHPSHLAMLTQQSVADDMDDHRSLGFINDESAYLAMPTIEFDSGMEHLNDAGEWVIVDNQGKSLEASDAAEKDEVLDSLSSLVDESSFADRAGSPASASDVSDRVSKEEEDSVSITGAHDLDKPKKSARKRLSSQERQQTSNTRKLKACVRCRMQKIRCLPDENDPSGVACLSCSGVSQKSKKVIHRLPCLRWILTETTICRAEGVILTKRWSGTEMKNLRAEDWVSNHTHDIEIKFVGFSKPASFKVWEFTPVKDLDCTHRRWKDEKGEHQMTQLTTTQSTSYTFRDVNEAAKSYREYVGMHMLLALKEFVENKSYDEQVRNTYRLILDALLEIKEFPLNTTEVSSTEFLRKLIWMWFGNRNTLGSATLEGKDRLGMEPDDREGHPHRKGVSVPRMISAQFNNISYCTVLRPMRKLLLEELWKMMASKNPQHFFTIYLAVFMMLREISAITKDRRRWAEDNGLDREYSLPDQVEALQEGAKIILSHWHYYKRGFDPMTTDWKKAKAKGKKTVWAELTTSEIEHLVGMCRFYNETMPSTTGSCRASNGPDLDGDHYWTSQMFEENWRPRRTFMR